jgi:UDP-4-amino-4-deoxy-L-arabinose-oxoglutarate aminotransferase
MNIPHSKPLLEAEDHAALADALASGMIASGERAERFEREVADREGLPEALTCASGTAALVLALRALGIGAGKEVILPTYVCSEVLAAVLSVGATPVLCDIGPAWLMTPESVLARMTPKVGAIILVRIFGYAAPAMPFASFGVPIILDAAQAFGTPDTEGAEALVLSFHATKCLATGEGGMVLFRDPAPAARARALRDGHGEKVPSPFSDLQAALGLSQLRAYPRFLARRRQLAARYRQALADTKVTLPVFSAADVIFRFTVLWDRGFEQAAPLFAKKGVQVRRGVDALLHRNLGGSDSDFANACDRFEKTISLPLYPALRDEEADTVLAAAVEIFGET